MLTILFATSVLFPSILGAKEKTKEECESMKKSGFTIYRGCGIEEAQTEEKSYQLRLNCVPIEHLGLTLGQGHPKDLQGTRIKKDLMGDPFQLGLGDRTCKYIGRYNPKIFVLIKSDDAFKCRRLSQRDSEDETNLKEENLSIDRYNGTAIYNWDSITIDTQYKSSKKASNKTKYQCKKEEKKF